MAHSKKYGESQISSCPFCGKNAFLKNTQGVSVCSDHKRSELPIMKCSCKEILDMKTGKFGVYFNCEHCGTISMKKALSMNPKLSSEKISKKKNVTVVTSEEVDVFYS